MTMWDQILHILSPQKDCDKIRKNNINNNFPTKKNKFRKGKKNEKKPTVEEKKPYLEVNTTQLHPLNLHDIIRLPPRIDEREWIATHTIALFHNVNLEYGCLSEFCTASSCPTMQGAGQSQYIWQDDKGKKLKCTAPQYIDYVMTYCQKCVSNQELFPTKYAQHFHPNFKTEIQKTLRFLFHVISHMYSAHFNHLQTLNLHGHLNIILTHFVLFVHEFGLLDAKEYFALDDLINYLDVFKKSSPQIIGNQKNELSSNNENSVPSSNDGQSNNHNHNSILKGVGNKS